MTFSNDLASGLTDRGSISPEELFAGDAPVVTDWANATTNSSTSFAKFEVVAIDRATNSIIKHVPGGTGDQVKAVAVLAQPIPISTTAARIPFFVGGFFNHEILTWEASLTTLEKRKAALVGTMLFAGVLDN